MKDLLTTEDIMERYKLQRQAAAILMHKMPLLKIGKRLYVSASDLEAWERSKTVYPVTTGKRTALKVCKIERRRA